MSDEIKPALAAEEWAAMQGGEPLTFLSDDGLEVVDAGDGTKFYVRTGARAKTFTHHGGAQWVVAEIDRWDTDGLVQLAAVLLSHLPDDHLLKITRHDVADLQRACDIMEQIEDGSVWRRYVRLRDKLAALLPPEGQPNE